MTRTHIYSTLILCALLDACGRTSDDVKAASAKAQSSTPVVATALAVVRQVSANVQSTGSFVALESSDVAPDVAGRIVATQVNVGDSVQTGQTIARLDAREATVKLQQAQAYLQQAEAAVRQAQARIGLAADQSFDPNKVPEVLAAKAAYESAAAQARLAQADATRYENLINTGDVSRSAYDKAKTQVETAEAQLNAARQQFEATANAARQNYNGVANSQASLDQFRAALALAQKGVADTTIRAPFAGYVSARPVAAGEYVALTAKIATILRITPIKLQLQVPETNAPRMTVGLDVLANVPGYPSRDFAGKVTAINPQVDANSRTFTVEAEFPNRDLALKPGMFSTARVQLPGDEQGIFIPQRAVIKDATTNSSQVFFIRDNKARLAVVQLGETDGDRIRIVTGLSPDAVVALDHLQDLYDGETVKTEAK